MVLERDTPETVSAYAAKTHLSRLLHSVETGQQFLITRRGKPIARLVPADAGYFYLEATLFGLSIQRLD